LCYIAIGSVDQLIHPTDQNDEGEILGMVTPASSPSPAVDAQQILNMNYAFAQTAMLIAAIRLHLFTALA
jgi:hypothetical protein